ncbi:hypothetical protein CEXT_567911 [Caerostris extrusa]|uniref:Uncharacterized protein n=1 Tax=Caerostris extrusa TaxID=172846 RepID=A0AAV4VZI3_CAEEX|nr:hypothetical protein CEXT_567911 [Caerostris extrusa]
MLKIHLAAFYANDLNSQVAVIEILITAGTKQRPISWLCINFLSPWQNWRTSVSFTTILSTLSVRTVETCEKQKLAKPAHTHTKKKNKSCHASCFKKSLTWKLNIANQGPINYQPSRQSSERPGNTPNGGN